jgi:hypothetical protein
MSRLPSGRAARVAGAGVSSAPSEPLPEPKEWEQEPDMFNEEWREAADDPMACELAAKRRRCLPAPALAAIDSQYRAPGALMR